MKEGNKKELEEEVDNDKRRRVPVNKEGYYKEGGTNESHTASH